jgi:hypothetical protein
MSNTVVIRNFKGKVLGSIETKPNGDKIVRDFLGKILGRYDKKQDVTRDFLGKILARGDMSSMLINLK